MFSKFVGKECFMKVWLFYIDGFYSRSIISDERNWYYSGLKYIGVLVNVGILCE